MNGKELLDFMAESMFHRRIAVRMIGKLKDYLHLSPSEEDILAEDDEIILLSASLISL